MTPLLILAVLLLIVIYFYRGAKERPDNFPPGPPRLPIWGSYWLLLLMNYKYIHIAINKMAQKYKTKILGFYLGAFPTVVVSDYKNIREILTRPEFNGRMDTFIARERSLGKLLGVMLVDSTMWEQQRRFMLRNMRDFGFDRRHQPLEDVMEQQIQDIIDIIDGRRKELALHKDGLTLFPDIFYLIFINSLWFIFAGDLFPLKDVQQICRVCQAGMTFQQSGDPTGGALALTPWIRHFGPKTFGYLGMHDSNEYLLGFIKEEIDKHLAAYSSDHMRDFMDIFIREMKKHEELGEPFPYTAEQLLITGLDLLLPTTTTVTSTLGFLVQYLTANPHVQVKIQNELDTVIGRDRLPTLDDRQYCPYTEAAIREGMRRETLIPLSIAHRVTEDTLLDGYFIPKDTMIMPNIWGFHMDKDFWGDPEVFRPERFLDEDGQLLKKDYSLPFGAGKRLCAAETFSRQNMFLIMAALLQNFTFKTPDGKMSAKVPPPQPGILVTPKQFWVRAEPRT